MLPAKPSGDRVVEMLAFAENTLAANAHQRKSPAPLGLADRAKLDRDGGAAVGIAGNRPLEAEVAQGRMLNREAAGSGAVFSVGGGGEEEKQKQSREAHQSEF